MEMDALPSREWYGGASRMTRDRGGMSHVCLAGHVALSTSSPPTAIRGNYMHLPGLLESNALEQRL